MTKETKDKYKELATIAASVIGALLTAFGSVAVYWNNLNIKLAQHDEKLIAAEKADSQVLCRFERLEVKMDDMKENFNKFKIELFREIKK